VGKPVIFVTCRTSSLKAKIILLESEMLGLTVHDVEDKSYNITNIKRMFSKVPGQKL